MARYIPPREPVLEGQPFTMARTWYLFFQNFMDPPGFPTDEALLLSTGADLGSRADIANDDAALSLLFLTHEAPDDLAASLSVVHIFPDAEDVLFVAEPAFEPEDALTLTYIEPDCQFDELGHAPGQLPDATDLLIQGFAPGASLTPANIGDVVFEFTNNTTLTIRGKGSDGTVRSVALTLA